ncbi:hypothetical protein J7444_23795 [Labrenzia sp. R4_1]|uniref:hypothetical protein n=1 Tax=Labrenzia sp. R4_1 TaxID=2821106 RepID=UPI001ADB3D32|nr:hypothetical protein [Labrenzia sp. R4_1]MBO9427782.1 hypothetical protein [Labrenzia sp. R4_1]
MIEFQLPKKPKTIRESAPDPEVQAVENRSQASKEYKDLNFKVPYEFWREYKSASGLIGLFMVDILKESFQLWCKKNNFKMPTDP